MASSKAHLQFILKFLFELDEITYRAMACKTCSIGDYIFAEGHL